MGISKNELDVTFQEDVIERISSSDEGLLGQSVVIHFKGDRKLLIKGDNLDIKVRIPHWEDVE